MLADTNIIYTNVLPEINGLKSTRYKNNPQLIMKKLNHIMCKYMRYNSYIEDSYYRASHLNHVYHENTILGLIKYARVNQSFTPAMWSHLNKKTIELRNNVYYYYRDNKIEKLNYSDVLKVIRSMSFYLKSPMFLHTA